MTKAFRQPGKSITITGSAASVAVGSVYRRTGAGAQGRAWIGVVTDKIVGTNDDQVTIDGRPIVIGDGVSAEAQKGEGKGDMAIEGVYTLALPESGTSVVDSQPLYMNVADTAAPGTVASGVTPNGGAAISGACVGFAVGANYTGTSAPFTGMNVVDVKLLGNPLHGLAEAAPIG